MSKRHVFFLLAGLSIAGATTFIFYPRSERTIEVTECTKCIEGNCKVEQHEKYVEKYIITSKAVTVMIRNRDGRVGIQELGEADSCKILPREGFAFDCHDTSFSRENGADYFREYDESYNGLDTYIETRSERRFLQGRSESTNDPLFNYKRTCKVK